MRIDNQFAGQMALITGASSGIGAAIALELAAGGAMLCLVGRRADTLQQVARQMQDAGCARCIPCDIANDHQLEGLVQLIHSSVERLDIVVHSAGAIIPVTAERASMDDFDHQFRVNVRAPYELTRRVLPQLERWQGQVVFINSTAGHTARAGVSQYAATKHALRAVADSLRDEVNVRAFAC